MKIGLIKPLGIIKFDVNKDKSSNLDNVKISQELEHLIYQKHQL